MDFLDFLPEMKNVSPGLVSKSHIYYTAANTYTFMLNILKYIYFFFKGNQININLHLHLKQNIYIIQIV